MRDFRSSGRYSRAMLALVVCAGTAGAQEDRAVEAFERLGAIIRRDEIRPNRPVVAVIFGLRPAIPDTASETLKDALLTGFPIPTPTTVKVRDEDLADLSKLEHLQVLDLCSSEITNQALHYIKDLKNLQVLDLPALSEKTSR
jgi:hypothetical protein